MHFNFEDKVVVVTGAAKGIGAATASAFGALGAKVVLLDIDPDGTEIAEKIGDKASFIFCNVANHDAVKDTYTDLQLTHGHVDILVNNAGIQILGTVTETDDATWDRVMSVNLKSAFLNAKYAIPLMLDRPNPVIINVASVQSFLVQTQVAAYVTSKSGLLGLTRSIAVDYAPKLRCVAVCPGSVNTPMLQAEFNKFEGAEREAIIKETEGIHLVERISTPEEIANCIVYLASEHAGFITGQEIRIDGGIGVKLAGV